MSELRLDHCIVCGCEREFELWATDIHRCTSCSLMVCLEPPSPEEIELIYSEGYFRGEEYFDYLEANSGIRQTLNRRRREVLARVDARERLLEVGCAYGYFLDSCRADFEDVVGIDISRDAVSHARDKLELDARVGDLVSASFPGDWADAVCMWDTIEHLTDPSGYLAETRRILKPGGMLFLTTGDLGSIVARVRGRRWRQIHPNTHYFYFSRDTISRLLDRLGFDSLEFRTSANIHRLDSVFYNLKIRQNPLGRLGDIPLLKGVFSRVELSINLGDIMFVAARIPRNPRPAGS